MQHLKVCVIGAGDMGARHTAGWQKVPDVEVVAVCDIVEERARALQREYGIAAVYSDYQTAFAHPDIDMVSVCIPTGCHREVSEAAMRRGYHVLCEKPLAMSQADGEAMIVAAEETGVKFALGLCKRFSPQVHKLRELVQGGAIGRPVMYRHTSGIEVRPKRWIMDKTQGGGPIIDVLCHYIDQCRIIFASNPTRVTAMGLTLSTDSPILEAYDPQVDTATIVVEYESGDIGSFSSSWGLPEKVSSNTLEDFLGADGVIKLEGLEKLTLIKADNVEEVYEGLGADMIGAEISAFAEAIREDKPVAATGEDGLIALRVSLAALRSIATGQTVKL